MRLFSNYLPKFVLCFLGKHNDFFNLQKNASLAILNKTHQFNVDFEYALNFHDHRMPESFEFSWDRLNWADLEEADFEAPHIHGCVQYITSQNINFTNAISIGLEVLDIISFMLEKDALAAKIESSGIAHSKERWITFANQIKEKNDYETKMQILKSAFVRRPIGIKGQYNSVGMHLLGKPDIRLLCSKNINDIDAAKIMDLHLEAILMSDNITSDHLYKNLYADDWHKEDSFQFNPFGIITIQK